MAPKAVLAIAKAKAKAQAHVQPMPKAKAKAKAKALAVRRHVPAGVRIHLPRGRTGLSPVCPSFLRAVADYGWHPARHLRNSESAWRIAIYLVHLDTQQRATWMDTILHMPSPFVSEIIDHFRRVSDRAVLPVPAVNEHGVLMP